MPRLAVLAAAGISISALTIGTSAGQSGALKAAADALGAAGIRSITYTGSGASFTVGQAYTAGEAWPRVNVTSYTASIHYDSAFMRVELVRTMPNPPPPGGGVPFQGEQRQVQVVKGPSAWNVPQQAAGRAGAPPAPAPLSAAVAAERLLQLWSTPHGFLRAAAKAANATTEMTSRGTEVSFAVDGKHKVTGVIDAQHHVERVRTWVDNAVLGDMLVETVYSGYRDFGGVMFPSRIQVSQGGHPSLDLTIASAQANAAVDSAVPDSVRKPAPPAPIQVAAEQVAPGVHYLTGGSHHSVAIEMRDHVVVVEGPQSEARGLAVIAKTKELIPNKPIRFVVNTHVHFDHSGGLRPFVDEGATVVTHRSNRAFYAQAWAAPRTINPDRLAQSKKPPQFVAFGDRGQLTDGTRKIELHVVANNPHTSGIMVAYLPAEKILIEVDLYAPGPAGAAPPAAAAPLAIVLADNIQRLKLDVGQILALHGPRVATMADLRAAIGRSPGPLPHD